MKKAKTNTFFTAITQT